MSTSTTGGCLCASVRYSINGTLRNVVNCHCRTCSLIHGSYGAYSKANIKDVTYDERSTLKWFLSTDTTSLKIARGFCDKCGSSLFWHVKGSKGICVAAGSLDQPTDLSTVAHIWVKDKADFYSIVDSLPQNQCGLAAK